jgi:hypothetical protein
MEKHSPAESRSIQSPGRRVVLGFFFVLQQFQTPGMSLTMYRVSAPVLPLWERR